MRYPAFVDGELHAPGEGRISTDDQGFLLGLSVFETLLYEQGCVYFEEQHLARLEQGARALDIPFPLPWDPVLALATYCRALGARDVALRVTLTRGVLGERPTLVIGARELYRPPDPGVAVVLEHAATHAHDALAAVKSTNRVRNVLARERAMREGAYEALLCTDEGDVAEGTLSNVFAVVDGALITPALDRGCLAGIMRGELLALCARAGRPVHEARLELELLRRASEVFLSNTTGRVIPVVEVRGLVEGLPGSKGPVASALRQSIRAREAEYRASKLSR